MFGSFFGGVVLSLSGIGLVASSEMTSEHLDGPDASNHIELEQGVRRASWWWKTPGLLDQLEWISIHEAQVAADMYLDTMHRGLETHREMSQRIQGGELPVYYLTTMEMSVWHKPTQRLLKMVGEGVQRRHPHSRDGRATKLHFFPTNLPRKDMALSDGTSTMINVAIEADTNGECQLEITMVHGRPSQEYYETRPRVMSIDSGLIELQHAAAWSAW